MFRPIDAEAAVAARPSMDVLLDWIAPTLLLPTAALLTLWVAGAIYYDAFHATRWGRFCAAGWTVGVVVLFVVWQPLWQPFAVLLGVTALFLVWWLRQKPSQHRDWEP